MTRPGPRPDSDTGAESRQSLRIIRSGPLHPTLNMGLDEALLLAPNSPATLRLYRWQPAGVSLGYFQSSAPFGALAGEHVLVRRLTGGGAIFHGDEITFALTIDADQLPMAVPESYDLIHGAVHDALLQIGVATSRPAAVAKVGPRPEQPWCFADPVAEDLLSRSGHKLVGSAQRRIRRPTARILHHGSIPLHAPAATPFCGSIAEYCDPTQVESQLETALVERLAADLGLSPVPGSPTEREQDHATALAAERYGDPGFTHRR